MPNLAFLRLLKKFILLNTFLIFFHSIHSMAQTVEIPSHIESNEMNSGILNGKELKNENDKIAYSGLLEVSDSPWLRILFDDAYLGKESYIIIRSVLDDKWQKLDTKSLEQWNFTSAYFNGNRVMIELHVDPFDKNIFFRIKEVIVGDYLGDDNTILSQCGPTDDRVSSYQPATGRILSVSCTAWIIPNGNLVTAGHCLESSTGSVVQFSVPSSLPDGTIQNPDPKDQYSINFDSKVYVNAGIGDDWGTFGVFPNSVTGLLPKEAQGTFWNIGKNLNSDSIGVTGYGVDANPPGETGDCNNDNRTQQTHVGINAGSSGFILKYVTDTEGGNSGSPVIDEATGNAIGVHTHAGCNMNGGNNHGTSFFNKDFWTAVSEGTIPVELIKFVAFNHNRDVVLNWSTATETNNMGFEIQRSANGTDFYRLTFVEGRGTATETQDYTYIDKNLDPGRYTYRLKQMDFDGSSEYSHVAEMEITAPHEYSLEQNFPNPFNPVTKIKFGLASDSNVTLKVFDVLGQEVANLINNNLSAGLHDIDFNAAGIHSGVYFYRIDATGADGTNFTSVNKMILTK